MLLLLACLGVAAAPPGAPVPAEAAPLARIDASLPFDTPVAVLDGTARLLDARSSHTRDGRETSTGRLELTRGGATEIVAFSANQPFTAWERTMVVFGASGSYQLSVFPLGARVTP